MSIKGGRGALCVQMDFTRVFQTITKCNNINHVALLLQLCYFEHLLQKKTQGKLFRAKSCFFGTQ